MSDEESIAVYGIDDRPPLVEMLPLGLQHVLAMFLGNVAPPIIIAGAVGLNKGETAFLIQMALVVAGAATVVQAYPIGPVGARLPIVMGTSFVGISALSTLGTQFNLAVVFGACLVASVVEVIFGFFYGSIRTLFPPLVTSIVVMLIGLTLIPVGIDYAAGVPGQPGAAAYGSLRSLALAAVVLLVTIGLNQYVEGFLRIASVMIGIVVGYATAYPMGMLDLSPVAAAAWFEFPVPLKYGLAFEWPAIVTVAFLYVITTVETIGDISGTTEATGRRPEDKEIKGGLVADGVMSAFGALFNAFPNTSFSQNVGLINFTGVASRHIAGVGGVVLLLLGFVPKVGAVVSAMPDPVLGGGGLVMFAMIFSSGVRILANNVQLNQRNMTILAVSFSLGLGVEFRPEVLGHFAESIQMFFGSGLITGGMTAVVLNQCLPAQANQK